MWGVQGELWCRDADHEVSEVYCQFQHVLLAPTNAWYVKTWAVGSLVPRPSPAPVFDGLQAIKNWSRRRPGNEARL